MKNLDKIFDNPLKQVGDLVKQAKGLSRECEVCGVKLDNENSDNDADRCFNCRDEWGDSYPDRI